MNKKKPHFIIKNKFQKRSELYSDILTNDILKDVCQKVTGCEKYTCEFINVGYNKGRMAILEYSGVQTFISFSETGKVQGRNYFFQSLTTALVRYYLSEEQNKRICFYFLPLEGSFENNYYMFMYRLMATCGVEFLNSDDLLSKKITLFNSLDDIMLAREKNKERNKSNNSTYVTRDSQGITQIYGKTYGASKKETTLLAVAASKIVNKVQLYQICEKELSSLPKKDLEVLAKLQNIEVIQTSRRMERNAFEKEDNLRSPRFIYNLFKKLGPKRCALCGCEIPELVQGAHIWPVAYIKSDKSLDGENKFMCATDGENGIWLCENHHKLFDKGIVIIAPNGIVGRKKELVDKDVEFIEQSTQVMQLPQQILTVQFKGYLNKRYYNKELQDKYVQISN